MSARRSDKRIQLTLDFTGQLLDMASLFHMDIRTSSTQRMRLHWLPAIPKLGKVRIPWVNLLMLSKTLTDPPTLRF